MHSDSFWIWLLFSQIVLFLSCNLFIKNACLLRLTQIPLICMVIQLLIRRLCLPQGLLTLPLMLFYSDDVKKLGFTVIIDMRGSTWHNVKPILRVLQV